MIKPIFIEKGHIYKSELGFYTSMTTLIDRYKNKFDTEYWSKYKAIERYIGIDAFKNIKYKYGESFLSHIESKFDSNDNKVVNQIIQEIKEEWKQTNKESLEKGTKFHNEKEDSTKKEKNYAETKHLLPTGTIENCVNLYDLPDGIYTELLVWNNNFLIAGKIDKVTLKTIGDLRYVDVDDYKTNKKLDFNSYKSQKMFFPINHIEDCNFNHYQLQLSGYMFMLCKFGFFPGKMNIIWNNQNYPVTYLFNEVLAIFSHHNNAE
jgi:hypothetical protein